MTNAPSPPIPLRPGLRSEWLLDERITFLNHGSFGAVPRCVFDAQTEWRLKIEAEPIEIVARQLPQLLAAARRPIGAWLGMDESDFGFVTNATEGVNAVLQSLELRAGDELLTTTHVYNAVRQAMRFAAKRAGATCREVDIPLPANGPEEILAAVLAALTPRTRLLVIDHITSPTALVFPVEAIVAGCAERGVDVLIDGAHGPGMVRLNVAALGAAYYAGNLHKWACGPKGSGFLWVRRDRQKAVHPLVISHFLDEGFTREFNWQGTRDFGAWLSVPRALEFFADLGWDRVMDHNHQLAIWTQAFLAQRWGVEPVSPLDGRMLGSMATIPLPPPLDHLEQPAIDFLQRRLYDAHRIEAPLLRFADRTFVRPCCQLYNSPADYERLGDAIERMGVEFL